MFNMQPVLPFPYSNGPPPVHHNQDVPPSDKSMQVTSAATLYEEVLLSVLGNDIALHYRL